ncbi:MAG TPA: hypothetical protein VFC19_02115 [Candidatus Limnocylindrales bacterium]|nr:hypothetical protein [Candidatus Limnocylindrales bacterium]
MRRKFIVSAVLAAALAAPSGASAGFSAGTDEAGFSAGTDERARPDNWVTAWAASPVVGVFIPFNPGCPAGIGLGPIRR